MASAAAVAADASRSPLPYQEHDDVWNTTGTITGADVTLPDEVPAAEDDDDEDDDILRPGRRKPGATMLNGSREKDSEEDDIVDDKDADEELFGSDPDDAASSPLVHATSYTCSLQLTFIAENRDNSMMRSLILATTRFAMIDCLTRTTSWQRMSRNNLRSRHLWTSHLGDTMYPNQATAR